MVDNVAITAGTGTNVASDDIAGVHHQRVKLSLGADGAATDALGGTGTVGAGVQRVTLATDVALPTGNNNIGDVDIASIAAGDNNIGNVDVVTLPSLPAGTNNIGDVDVLTLPALPAGTNNIGDVDVLSVVPGTGATNLGKAVDSAAGATDTGVALLAVRDDALGALTPAEGDYVPLRVDANGHLYTILSTSQIGTLGQSTMAGSTPVAIASDQTAIPVTNASSTTIKLDVPARPADTTAYAVNDAWSDSTTVPTTGGFTITGAGRISGGSGIILDAIVSTDNDAATLLQGEIIIFDQAVTNINDNTAFAITDTERKNYVGKIPFSMEDFGNNGTCYVPGLNLAYTCVGSANLRFLIRVKNAYTPASGEVLSLALKVMHTS